MTAFPFIVGLASSAAAITAVLPAGPTAPGDPGTFGVPETVILLALLGLLPFLAVMVTSFAKMAVVLGILRSALGTASVPPTTVLTALALLLSFFVMAPVARESLSAYQRSSAEGLALEARAAATLAPLESFLLAHVDEEDLKLFGELAAAPDAPPGAALSPSDDDRPPLRIIVPAFLIGELRAAFQLGFLLFLPFMVIDLVVSAVTLSLGMQMLSPTTLSMPLKLLLFVSADGWRLLCEALVRGYLPGGA